MSQARKITVSEEVLAQEVDGETVLLDLGSETYFGLDPVATRVWRMLQDGLTPADMIDALLREFDVARDVLESDVTDLLAELERAGLVRRD